MKTLKIVCLSLFMLIFSSACGPVILPSPAPQIQDVAFHLAWSPDSRWLAASGASGLYLFDATTYQQKAVFPAAANADIAFGTRYMATNDGQTVRAWDLQDDRLLFQVAGAPINFQSVAVSRDDRLLATGEQKHFRVWSLPDGALLADMPVDGFVSNLAFTADNNLIVILQYKAVIQTWNLQNKTLNSFEIPRDVIFFTLGSDGKSLLVDYGDPGFELWDISSGKAQRNYKDAISAAGWERLSGNNRYAVTWGTNIDADNSSMSVWDLSSDSRVHEFATPYINGDGWRGGALNTDGSVLAASNNQGYVYFYSLPDGRTLGQFHLPHTPVSSP